MNAFKAFFRQYKYDFLALLVNILTAYLSFNTTAPRTAFIATLIVFAISMVILIYVKTRDKDFYFLPLKHAGDEKDWVGRGKFGYVRIEDCFEITNSDAGFIFPKITNWDDYKFEFDFKIANSSVGCIVRAINLSNYVMYQIFENRIKPHIRFNGQWVVMAESFFNEKIMIDKWCHARVICEKRGVRLNISCNKKNIVDRHFTIPEQFGVVYRELNEHGEETKRETKLLQNMDFDFGAVGIRNYGDERAFVKNVFLERL